MTDDRQLARRLAREAKVSAKTHARVQQVHAKAVRRRESLRAKARRALPVRSALAVGTAVAAVPLAGGLEVLALVVAGGSAVRALGALRALRRPPLPPLAPIPLGPVIAPPPHPTSAAWPAVRRLEAVRVELQRLLPLVAPAGHSAGAEAWAAAAEADGALRWQAARLAAVEPHRGADPDLVRALYGGVECQERLVAAVADLVAASADPMAEARLRDVTDRLHGLAQGLREVR